MTSYFFLNSFKIFSTVKSGGYAEPMYQEGICENCGQVTIFDYFYLDDLYVKVKSGVCILFSSL